jgi:hypothetical protein
MKSIPLSQKLDAIIQQNPVVEEIDTMLDEGIDAFDSPKELKEYLTEGSLLNIGKISADALSIPNGKYMVWTSDVGHTMLVPIRDRDDEVFESKGDQFEVLTPALLGNWKGVSKCLSEEQPPEFQSQEEGGEDKQKGERGRQFQSKVDPAAIDRNPMLRAMEQQGQTVTSLARAVGVDPPMISRLLRTPKDRQGDPGGRNPSIGTAAKISNVLRMDPTALFPDIFGAEAGELGPRQSPGNRGSGMTGAAAGSARKGKATQKWTQGGGPPSD